MTRRLALVAAATFLAAAPLCGQPSGTAPLRVLFIGNSLTAWNNLPATVETLAEAGGQGRPVTRTVVVGGFSLEDHWNRGEAQKVIAQGPWDIVVLQQGPSALIESRRLLVAYAERFTKVIRAAGAQPALYMVWPSTDRSFDFPGVSTSYRGAATATKGLLLPAGDAWRQVLKDHRDITLYSDDGLHPTPAGSYLAALVIYRGLYKATTLGLPALGLPEDVATRLQKAAEK